MDFMAEDLGVDISHHANAEEEDSRVQSCGHLGRLWAREVSAGKLSRSRA